MKRKVYLFRCSTDHNDWDQIATILLQKLQSGPDRATVKVLWVDQLTVEELRHLMMKGDADWNEQNPSVLVGFGEGASQAFWMVAELSIYSSKLIMIDGAARRSDYGRLGSAGFDYVVSHQRSFAEAIVRTHSSSQSEGLRLAYNCTHPKSPLPLHLPSLQCSFLLLDGIHLNGGGVGLEMIRLPEADLLEENYHLFARDSDFAALVEAVSRFVFRER